MLNQWVVLIGWCLVSPSVAGDAVEGQKKPASEACAIAEGCLRVGLDPSDGSLRELSELPGGDNLLDGRAAVLPLWQIAVRGGATTEVLDARRAGAPRIERLTGGQPGVKLVWERVTVAGADSLRVECLVRLGQYDARLSRWEISVEKPKHLRLGEIRFPRLAGLRKRPDQRLAVPKQLGLLARDPHKLLGGRDSKGARLTWRSPNGTDLALPCLAFYQQDGLGFYAACDDPRGFRKDFSLWGDGKGACGFEIVHEPEQEAAGATEHRLPFAVMLGAFQGDWTAAAEIYRESPAAKAIAGRGRLARRLVPGWLPETGLWLWNRGRSEGVLGPAVAMRKYVGAPVSVLWHWWHGCPYDAGFPEYLPPREGRQPFQKALADARSQDVHAILYMNQRLWGTMTRSWAAEGAEAHAVKDANGKIRPEVYNVFMKAPCVPMCIGTAFWRDKYAGLAQEVLLDLKPSGVYMDQTGVWANCYDPDHGHIPGPGRYWTDGLATLTGEIRDRTSPRGPVALGGEYCGEPWIGNLDLTLVLSVSHDRIGMGPAWEPIPFFTAVYHPSTIVFGSMAGLVHPPYDEKWPPEKCPPGRLSLLDRKFSSQFYLDHARTFVWGIQPMMANFLPSQIVERPEELDFVRRMVATRQRSLAYLLHGQWLRPPMLDVLQEEIDVAELGTYTPLRAARRTYPQALAGAWRAAGGDVGIAVASIDHRPIALRLPIDSKAYGLTMPCAVYRIDESGRHAQGRFDPANPQLSLDLPPRGICVLEFCPSER